ncbi:MAG TPA: hypothetical protein HA306_03860 [Methanosarcina sp.]|nr:hypothetical protein [Methanosarcina sp.]
MPEISQEEKKWEWLHVIETCILSSENEISPYMRANDGSLIGFGYSVDGYIFVEFDEELRDKIDESTMDELYTIINSNGKYAELSDVPVVFRTASIPQEDSRTSTWTPLIGGIKIVRLINTGSTLSFAAEDSSGTKGFVMSGHAAVNGGGVGASIYQPNLLRKVGEVEDIGGTYADAAWVETTDVTSEIYHTDTNILKDVTNYNDTSVGSTVYMSGITSGKQTGDVIEAYIQKSSPTFGTLSRQFKADYESDEGDSGAPVYKLTSGGVKIVGVHWGSESSYTYFSPISGVISDLGVEPLTV